MSADQRRLTSLHHTASTARVLNLVSVAKQYGDTDEYKRAPFFRCARLNHSIILKHTIRAHERDFFTRRGTATKIIFPFSSEELELGGESIFVGEKNFARILPKMLRKQHAENDVAFDIESLQLIDSLPSLDPFLLREKFRKNGREPARCYFQLSDADVARMQKFVAGEIARLVEIAFVDSADLRRHSATMAELLMTDESASRLEPLRATLGLTGTQYVEGVFAWKGFLYYRWLLGRLAPNLKGLFTDILTVQVLRPTIEERRQIDLDRRKIVAALENAVAHVRTGLGQYSSAFQALAEGEPAAFRTFLLRAPSMFSSIGEAMGVISHIHSYWSFQFPSDDRSRVIDIAQALELFGEFVRQVETFADKPVARVA